jgi:iron complex outermembrane receptor protein
MHTTQVQRGGRGRPSRMRLGRLPLAVAICCAFGSAAWAQDATQTTTTQPATGNPTANDTAAKHAKVLDTVTVTAQKRSENPQKVPISLDVIGDTKLQQLNVKSFDDYVKYLPTVSYDEDGPGSAQIYMRGVSDGSDGNHSGPLPSVGVYLDEEPITTIDGPLDLHIYDIARVESLAGPQGTLYGASSQAGTIRIITNKPDPKAFSASYSAELDSVDHGGIGNLEEGFVNIPFSPTTAIRVVAWDKHDAGYIDNVPGTRTFPSWGGTVSNEDCTNTASLFCSGLAKNNYNTVNTDGARAALQINLDDNWTITPSVIAQNQKSKGEFAFDPQVGDLELTHFYPEDSTDDWVQSALTVQGKVGNFDVTYAFAHLNRHEQADSDYSDYSFWYDTLYGSGAYICSKFSKNTGCLPGTTINPSQYIQSVDGFTKTSHEFRIASPADWRLNFVAGAFWEKQTHQIQQDYLINGLAPALSVPGWPNTIWLTEQLRTDEDEALFGEATYKVTDQLDLTAGIREFHVHNSLVGFFGFNQNYSSADGTALCFAGPFRDAPCTNLDKSVEETNHVGKVNLTYQIDPNKMVYATWSQGFRPGGINRDGNLPPYLSDYLDNYELGWKTTWLDNTLRWNGSVFDERWKNFQFALLEAGGAGLTVIKNANQAEIQGFETNLTWSATDNLQISGGGAFYNAKLTANYCGIFDPVSGDPVTNCPVGSTIDGNFFPTGPLAPKGTQLPITPKFKGDLIGRYNFTLDGMDAYFQTGIVHVGERTSSLVVQTAQELGKLPAYTTVDFSTGLHKNQWSLDFFLQNAFDSRGEVSRFAECVENVCAAQNTGVPQYPNGQVYVVPIAPRTIGVRFTQDFD